MLEAGWSNFYLTLNLLLDEGSGDGQSICRFL